MANNINIQTITWELQTQKLARAKAWQETVSRFSQTELPGLLEAVLAPYNNDKRHIMIDTVELDIGNIKNESELREQLQNALQRALEKQQRDPQKDEEYSFLDALKIYLEHGTLPWYADRQLFGDTALLYVQLTNFTPDQLRSAIKLHHNASAIRLIELIGPDQHLISFLQYLSGTAGDEVLAIATFIRTLIAAAFDSHAPNNYQTIITFKVLLQYLFANTTLDVKTFLKLWWTDMVKNRYLSLEEQGLLSQFITGLSRLSFTAISKTSAAQNEQWMDELRVIVGDTPSVPQVAEVKEDKTIAADISSFFVENAGCVLLYVYLKKVFTEAGLLGDDLSFISPELQMQAVRLLQFIICGHTNFKEYHLVLNKVLCGYDIDAPVIETTDAKLYDIEKANALLQVAIANWPKIGHTSVEGLRNSFLLRNGKLVQETGNWILYVERKGMDILMDSLPYTISVIKLPWMQKALYVQW